MSIAVVAVPARSIDHCGAQLHRANSSLPADNPMCVGMVHGFAPATR